MSLRNLPEAKVFQRPQNFQWDAPSDVLARWSEKPLAAADGQSNTITIFDVIGEDWLEGGFTARRCAAALRSIGDADVTVQINSPGGDMFEGIAIYNLLRAHKAKVTIEIMGWAASAASIIAMAGDEIVMGLGTFMMVHNAWGVVVGNRHDMRESADLFDGFDSAIVDIYEARSGLTRAAIEKLMDAETFMGPSEAVKNHFADRVDDALSAEPSNSTHSEINATRRLDAFLAQSGVPRSERRRMIKAAAGKHDAAGASVTHDADFFAAAKGLLDTIRK